MRKAVLVICLLNLILGMGVIFYSLGSFGIWGAFNTWSVAVALLLILLSYYLIGIVDQLEGSPDEDEVTRLEKGAMDSIMKTVDVPHFEKAKTLVDSYRKDESARPPRTCFAGPFERENERWFENGTSNRRLVS